MATNQRKHPLQFGREVVAGLLGMPSRADWKVCMPRGAAGAAVQQLETQATEEFKAAFAPFDPAGGE